MSFLLEPVVAAIADYTKWVCRFCNPLGSDNAKTSQAQYKDAGGMEMYHVVSFSGGHVENDLAQPLNVLRAAVSCV